MTRRITFTTPRDLGEGLQAVHADLSFIYIEDGEHRPHFNGGKFSESIPLDGLLPADRMLAENYVAMILRVTNTGEARTRSAAARAG